MVFVAPASRHRGGHYAAAACYHNTRCGDLSRPHAQDGVHTSLHQEGQMRRGTQTPIGDEHVSRVSGRVDRLHPGEIVGEQGRDHQLQEQARAGVEQPQEVGHRKPAPRPLHCRLAERVL